MGLKSAVGLTRVRRGLWLWALGNHTCGHCAGAAINKVPQIGWHKQQKFIVSQFCSLEVRNQGVGRVGSFWGLWGKICSMSLSKFLVASSVSWLVDGIPLYLHMIFPLYMSVSVVCLWVPCLYQSYWMRTHLNDVILTWLPLYSISHVEM